MARRVKKHTNKTAIGNCFALRARNYLRYVTNFHYALALLAGLVTALPTSEAVSEESNQKPELTLVLFDLYPFFFHGQDGTPSGMTLELVGGVLNELGIPYKTIVMPISRVFNEISNGRYDLTSTYHVPEIFPDIHFFGELGCQQIVLLPLKSSGIRNMKDIAGKRLTFVQGGRFDHLYSSSSKFTSLPAPNTLNMFRMAARGRVDAIIGNRMHLYAYRDDPISRHLVPEELWDTLDDAIPVMPIRMSFAMSKKSKFQHLVPVLENHVKQAHVQAEFARISIKYGEPTGGRCNIMKRSELSVFEALNGLNDEKVAEHHK